MLFLEIVCDEHKHTAWWQRAVVSLPAQLVLCQVQVTQAEGAVSVDTLKHAKKVALALGGRR